MKTDPELVQLLKEGDEGAFELVFNFYFEKLCLFAESITRSHDAAQEVVEDVFLQVWLNCTINPIEKSIKSYLYQSVYNNAIRFISRQRKDDMRLGDPEYSNRDALIAELQTPEYPVANLILKEIEEKAELIIRSLPDQCRKIYLLNRDQDLKYHEIAEKMNLSVGTVKTQMSRAFSKLRTGLVEFLYILF